MVNMTDTAFDTNRRSPEYRPNLDTPKPFRSTVRSCTERQEGYVSFFLADRVSLSILADLTDLGIENRELKPSRDELQSRINDRLDFLFAHGRIAHGANRGQTRVGDGVKSLLHFFFLFLHRVIEADADSEDLPGHKHYLEQGLVVY